MKIKKYLTEAKRDVQDIENVVLSTMDPKKREILKNRTTELTRLSKQLEKKIAELQASGSDPEALRRLNELSAKVQKLLAGKTFAMSKEKSDNDGIGDTDSAESAIDKAPESDEEEKDQADNNSKETNLDKDTEDDQEDSASKQQQSTNSGNANSNKNKADSEKSNTADENNDSDNTDEETQDDSDNAFDDGIDSDEDSLDVANSESQQSDMDDNSDTDDNIDSEETDDDTKDSESESKSNAEGDKQDNAKESDADNSAAAADDDDPVTDIFKKPENQRMQSSGSPNGKQPRLPKIDEIIKELSALQGEAKKGAIKALEDIIGNITESLHEAIEDKALEDISDEEYGDFVNSIIDELQKDASDITVSDDINKRKLDIQTELNDKMADRDLRNELEKDATKEKRVTAQKITANSAYGGYKSVDSFFVDLSDTIKNEITMAEVEAQSYREINPEYEGEDIIMKADVTDLVPQENKPNIAFFFDMSGS